MKSVFVKLTEWNQRDFRETLIEILMKPEASGSFAGQLKALREAAGFTQEELATLAGLAVHAVSALERGERRRPHLETVRALSAAQILGVRDAVAERTGATIVDESVHAPRAQAERDVRSRLGPERWARAYEAGRKSSIDALLKDFDRTLRKARGSVPQLPPALCRGKFCRTMSISSKLVRRPNETPMGPAQNKEADDAGYGVRESQ